MPLTLASNAITFTDNTSLSSGIITAPQLSAGAVQQSFGNTSGAFSFRNKIINGDLNIWQRGTSFLIDSTTSSRYTADRWRADLEGPIGTGSVTVTRQEFNFNAGQKPQEIVSTYFIRYATSSNLTITNGSFQFAFLNENIRLFLGKTFTLSFWARASASGANIGIHFNAWLGTGGTPVGGINYPTAIRQYTPLPNTWTKIVHTFTIPNPTGVTFGPDVTTSSFNFGISFAAAGTTRSNIGFTSDVLPVQSCNYDIAQLQLEEGPVATPFEQRSIGTELALCQRYYEQIRAGLEGYTTGFMSYYVPFQVQKRGIPQLTLISQDAGSNTDGINRLEDPSIYGFWYKLLPASGSGQIWRRSNIAVNSEL